MRRGSAGRRANDTPAQSNAFIGNTVSQVSFANIASTISVYGDCTPNLTLDIAAATAAANPFPADPASDHPTAAVTVYFSRAFGGVVDSCPIARADTYPSPYSKPNPNPDLDSCSYRESDTDGKSPGTRCACLSGAADCIGDCRADLQPGNKD